MKSIITVGYEIPGHSDLAINFRSNKTLLDSDIVVFCPELEGYDFDHNDHQYQGKWLYSDSSSFQMQDDANHWKQELRICLESGKNVFLILNKYEKFFIHTGQKQYSGTGRNTRTTNIVTESDNYQFIPLQTLNLTPTSGKSIKFLGESLFASFWKEFKEYLEYRNYIESNISRKIMVTKTGDKTIAGLIKVGKGNLILLPYIVQPETFTRYDEKKDKPFWTKEGMAFGQKLMSSILEIDGALSNNKTPTPDWLNQEKYISDTEKQLMHTVTEINEKVDKLSSDKSLHLDKINEEQVLKGLLFETGKILEGAIIKALQILGFQAENLRDGDLELDQVIISPEGNRLIGEAEGKDNSQVNIDKLRQLNTNLQEDLQREEVKEMATGILFGNGFRLTDPEDRGIQFTDKCLSAAKKTGVILIETSSLYKVTQHVHSSKNQVFAQVCRQSIQNSLGQIVKFPEIPNSVPEETSTKAES